MVVDTPRKRIRIAFVCVENAGRSQIAAAYAARAVRDRGVSASIDVISGGTNPAAAVHDEVRTAMLADGIDLADVSPSEIAQEDLLDSDVVITMGCSADDVCPATWSGETRDWALPDPAGKAPETVHEIRAEIKGRVVDLIDELTASSVS